jgi:hypothetical protein
MNDDDDVGADDDELLKDWKRWRVWNTDSFTQHNKSEAPGPKKTPTQSIRCNPTAQNEQRTQAFLSSAATGNHLMNG